MDCRPDLTVAAILEQEGRFLLVEERVSGRLVFNQPAGHVEDGEELVAAVVRETLEETAFHFEPQAVTGVYLWKNPDNGCSFLRVAFAGTCVGHEPGRALDEGIVRAVWLSRCEVEALGARVRSPMVARGIDDYLDGHRFPLEVLKSLDGYACSAPRTPQRRADSA